MIYLTALTLNLMKICIFQCVLCSPRSAMFLNASTHLIALSLSNNRINLNVAHGVIQLVVQCARYAAALIIWQYPYSWAY